LPWAGPFAYPTVMRLFVYEYTCGEWPDNGSVVEALRTEGAAMLRAILEDLSVVPGLELSTLIAITNSELLSSLRSLHVDVGVASNQPFERDFRDLARCADGTLVIAPEIDGLLLKRCQWVEEVGGRLLGPSAEAVRAAGDKWTMARHWTARGVPTPATVLAGSASAAYPAVLKPRLGAGSSATFLIRRSSDLPSCLKQAEQEGWCGEMILQSYVDGSPCSVSFLVGPAGLIALPPCRQHLSEDGRFHYQGGSLPLAPALADRAITLGRRAIECVSGLRGYVGADLVLGHATDGSEDAVIEINPRLTTSYIGLRALAETNLAEAMLQMATGDSLPGLRWRGGSVVFNADGQAERLAPPFES
jgi:tyramine---L-glutamate ligase